MFKVGDIIVGKPCTDKYYCFTNRKNKFIGKVVEIKEMGEIGVKVIKIIESHKSLIGAKVFVDSYDFELLKDNIFTVKKLHGD